MCVWQAATTASPTGPKEVDTGPPSGKGRQWDGCMGVPESGRLVPEADAN